jgi:hypothetical protein
MMMNICSTCQGAQSECQERLDADPDYRAMINSHLEPEGLRYERAGREWENKNLLWLLVEDIGLDALRERVVRPLEGLPGMAQRSVDELSREVDELGEIGPRDRDLLRVRVDEPPAIPAGDRRHRNALAERRARLVERRPLGELERVEAE